MSSWAPTKYKTKNWSTYNEALKRRGSLSIWFDPEMIWTPPPSGKRGRQCQFSDAAIQTCLTIKVLFGLPLRQMTGFVESLLKLVGLDWAVLDFSTLCPGSGHWCTPQDPMLWAQSGLAALHQSQIRAK